MKLADINAIADILGRMKLNRITDGSVRTVLVNDYLHLHMKVKSVKDEIEEFRRKFREDWADEMTEVEILRRTGKPLDGHQDYLDAVNEADRSIQERFDVEEEVSVKPVPLEAFLSSCGGEELTLGQVAFLQDNGIIEKE